MSAEAIAGLRRGARPARRRNEKRSGLGSAAQRWSAAAGAELGRSIRSRITVLNLLAALVLGAAAALHVWLGIEVDRLGYDLSRARVVRQQLARDLQLLRVEYAAATTPGELERQARERLGMVPPAPGQIVVLR
jgi:cell division protein FtsL